MAGSNYVLNRSHERSASLERVRVVLVEFLYVIGRAEGELRAEPVRGDAGKKIEKLVRTYAPRLDAAIDWTSRRLLNPTLSEYTEVAQRSAASLALTAPRNVMEPMLELTTLMATCADRDDEWWSRWDAARSRFVVLSRAAVGESVGS